MFHIWSFGRLRSFALATAVAVAAMVLAACGSSNSGTPSSPGSRAGGTQPAGTVVTVLPPLTPQGGNGQPVDGVQCLATEQLAYHIHAHLAIFVDGANVYVPAGIGITPPRQVENGFVVGGSCFYWLHTHDLSGVIHIESPSSQIYTLGQFFAIWGEPISSTQVATFPVSDSEPLHVFVDSKPYSEDPAQIPLNAHTQIVIEVGKQVPPPSYTFQQGL